MSAAASGVAETLRYQCFARWKVVGICDRGVGSLEHQGNAKRSPTITVRDQMFDREQWLKRWYMGGDPVATSFLNALSAAFPVGEKLFIDSVRYFHDLAPRPLQAQIVAFVRQEAAHTREHAAFNAQLETGGYDPADLNAHASREDKRIRGRSAIAQLGFTMALEHCTALLAHQFLADPRHLEAAPAEIQAMWRWHAVEEIEHKGVAFDTFKVVSQDWGPMRRWTFRAAVMLDACWRLLKVVALNMNCLYAQDGLAGFGIWTRTLRYLMGPRGVLLAMISGWLKWFAPNFHPWDEDDLQLCEAFA